MGKARNSSYYDPYESPFAERLRDFLNSSPTTEERHTQRDLAKYLNVSPQAVSQYCNGKTLPDHDTMLKIAQFFGITADHLITGIRPEDTPITEATGLSQETIECLKLVKDGYFEDEAQNMIGIIDLVFRDKDFYKAIAYAGSWLDRKKDLPEEQAEFCEWKAANRMTDFFLSFFAHNFNKGE